jgi:hypothetical protein
MKLIQLIIRAFLPCFTSADLTTLSDVLKEVYDPIIEDQQNLEAFTWKEFQDGDDELGGQGWIFGIKVGGNQEGIGARGERGVLPIPASQRWKQGTIYWKLLYGAFELTGPVIEAAKSNLKAFANARTDEIEGLTRDTIKDFNRQIFGDGTGTLALCTKANVTVTQEVDNAQYLRVNMMIDIWDAANPDVKNGDGLYIDSLSPNADGTCDVGFPTGGAPGTATAAGDVLIREDSAYDTDGVANGGTRTSYEMTGLQQIIDDGTVAATFENISRSDYPIWKGHVLDNSGTDRNLTLDLMQQAEDAVYRAASKRPNWNRLNLGQRRKFFDLVAPDKRYMSGRIDGGYERLEYNGLELTVDVDAPKGTMIFLTKDTVKKYSLRKFGLIDFDGLVLRQKDGKDLWGGYIGAYCNLGSKRPSCNAILKDLAEPTEEQWVW